MYPCSRSDGSTWLNDEGVYGNCREGEIGDVVVADDADDP